MVLISDNYPRDLSEDDKVLEVQVNIILFKKKCILKML